MTPRRFRHKDGFLSDLQYVECNNATDVCNCVNSFDEKMPNYFYTLDVCLAHVEAGDWEEITDAV